MMQPALAQCCRASTARRTGKKTMKYSRPKISNKRAELHWYDKGSQMPRFVFSFSSKKQYKPLFSQTKRNDNTFAIYLILCLQLFRIIYKHEGKDNRSPLYHLTTEFTSKFALQITAVNKASVQGLKIHPGFELGSPTQKEGETEPQLSNIM